MGHYYPGYDEEVDGPLTEPEPSAAPKPPTPPTAEQVQRGVLQLQFGLTSGFLAMMTEAARGEIPAQSCWEFANAIRAELKPRDNLEKLLIDGALLAHVKAGYLLVTSGTADAQRAEIYLKAAPKFMAECRKNILALREYRSPTAEKQITVVKQQNVAAGNQQIGCLVTQTMPTLTDSQPNIELLTTQVSQICSPPVLIEHQPEPQVDYLRDVFMQTPEVKECLATMDRARLKSTKKSSKRITADTDIPETPLFGPDHGIEA